MNTIRILVAVACLLMPFQSMASWLQLNKSQSGYLFEGLAPGEAFSFDVPGGSIQTSGDNGRAFAKIDDVLVQVMRAPIPAGHGKDILDAHMADEIAYLETGGAVVSTSTVCSKLSVPHREWLSTLANGSTSTYLTIRMQNHVLVIVLAADAATTLGPVHVKLSALCGSLRAA